MKGLEVVVVEYGAGVVVCGCDSACKQDQAERLSIYACRAGDSEMLVWLWSLS